MRELPYLINDVRECTDNTDINGVKDKEIIRYFQDGIRSIQAIVFKNNPLCSYFQNPLLCSGPTAGQAFDLNSDTYGDNAVSYVEVQSSANSTSDNWAGLERCWQEDQNSFMGWFTRNKTIVFSGFPGTSVGTSARVWYFQRLPRWDKKWATISSVDGQILTIAVLDEDMFTVDSYISIYSSAGGLKQAAIPYIKSSVNTITVTGAIPTITATDIIVMGKNTTLEVNLPEEVETYLVDYVSKRVATRNNYTTDATKIEAFTSEAMGNIISIFADVGQSQLRAPITDTEYLRV